MQKVDKILIPVDFSPVAEKAVMYADGILEKHPAEVVLVYINANDRHKEEIEIFDAFKAFESEVLEKVHFKYSFQLINGDLLTGIDLLSGLVRATQEAEANMVIIGTKGRRESDISLASALIRAIEVPVIVVPDHFTKNQIKKIAFANDYKPIKEAEAIKPLWEFTLEFGAKVYLLHVNQPRKKELALADSAESALEYYLDSLEHEYVYLKGEDVELTINNYIKAKDIDLLVILSRDHGRNQLKSEGRLINQLTIHAEIPILALC